VLKHYLHRHEIDFGFALNRVNLRLSRKYEEAVCQSNLNHNINNYFSLSMAAPATTDKENKLKALQTTLEKLDKTFGKGTVMRLSDTKVLDVPVISTGSLGLDLALGVGGVPRGRIVEIYGPESSGKTTLSMHCIAEAQKQGGLAAFIDAEHAFDRVYAEKLGIDTSNLLISQPDSGEQALEIAEHLISSGAVDIIVIDSVAALVPRAELEGEMGESKMGLQARLMSQALRKLTGVINKTGCCCIFINQLREKIGVMFGNPETTTGGNALKYYASVRLDIRRVGQIKESADAILGNRTKVKVVKNKVAPPFKVVEFDIMYGEGISKVGEVIDLAVELEIVKKAGSWFSYEGNRLGQGRDAVKALLKDNPELLDELEAKVRAKVNNEPDSLIDTSEPNVADEGSPE
jgi:recombination protein RecA